MDYNKDVDDNFDNFYFMNGQVVSLVICGLSRLGLMAGRNVNKSDQFIKQFINDINFRSLAVIIFGKCGIAKQVPKEGFDKNAILLLHAKRDSLTEYDLPYICTILVSQRILRRVATLSNLSAYRIQGYIDALTPQIAMIARNIEQPSQ